MKQIGKTNVVLVLALLLLATGVAQENRLSFQLTYNVQMPVGQFKNEVISKTSFNGWSAGIMYNLSEKFSLGAKTGFNQFTQQFPRQLYDSKDGTISAVLTNNVKIIPLQVKLRYKFLPDMPVQPYIGVAAGGNIISFEQYLGVFNSTNKTGFYFAATPDAGVAIPLGRSQKVALNVGANLNYVPFKYNGIDNLNNWGLYAGVKIPLK